MYVCTDFGRKRSKYGYRVVYKPRDDVIPKQHVTAVMNNAYY